MRSARPTAIDALLAGTGEPIHAEDNVQVEAHYLKDRWNSSRRMVAKIAIERISISCDPVRNLVRHIGFCEIHQTPNHDSRRSMRAISLHGVCQASHGGLSGMGPLTSPTSRTGMLPLSGGSHRSPILACAQLEAIQQS